MASSASASGSAPAGALTPPDDLKMIAPFLQRARETRKVDPPLSYWCTYHAAQMGIARMGAIKPASKTFLVSLMDALEAQKKELAGNDIVHGDDIVAKAHIENVALKVFGGADAEDRSGKATKATARRFLVAGNFIEVLTNFGPLDSEMEEKLKYAKWKAADIGKAIREGRDPVPGPAGGLSEEEQQQQHDGDGLGTGTGMDTLAGLEGASARLGGLQPENSLPSKDELDAEMARLTAGEGDLDRGRPSLSAPNHEHKGLAISPSIEPLRPAAQPSRISFDAHSDHDQQPAVGPPVTSVQSPDGARPNFSKPMRMSSYLGDDGQVNEAAQQAGLAGFDAGTIVTPPASSEVGAVHQIPPTDSGFTTEPEFPRRESTTSIRPPLPHPPSTSSIPAATARSPLPLPPQAQLPNDSFAPLPQPSQPPQFYHHQTQPSAPPSFVDPQSPPSAMHAPAPTYAHQQPPSAPLAVAAVAALPSSLDSAQTARVQKLAKWAVSALDYDDVETARKQLREALDICEGRMPQGTNGAKR